MQSDNGILNKQDVKICTQLADRMADFLATKKVSYEGSFISVVVDPFIEIFNSMQKEGKLTEAGLRQIGSLRDKVWIVNLSGSQFPLIAGDSHPLNIQVHDAGSVYIGISAQGGGEGGHDNHAYLCEISNNHGTYTYNVYDSLSGNDYRERIIKCLNKELITAENNSALNNMQKAKCFKKLSHIEEQEINYYPILNQEQMGEKFSRSCSIMPLVYLIADLYKKGQIDIKNFQEKISSLYNEIPKSPIERSLSGKIESL